MINPFAGVSVKAAATDKVIVIQPGHSIGYDPGACNSTTGVTEAQVNEKLACALAVKLDKAGYTVYLTHCSDDTYAKYRLGTQEQGSSLASVAALCNSVDPDLAISIHHNSGSSTASGYEFYWSSYRDYDTEGVYSVSGLWSDGSSGYRDSSPCTEAQNSKVLAEKARNAFSGSKLAYRSTTERDDYLPSHATCACILYEGGFISNNSESTYLNSSTYIEDASTRFLNAINDYFGGSPVSGSSSSSSGTAGKVTIDTITTSWSGDTTSDAVLKITLKGVSVSKRTVKKVQIPVWSDVNGQDDLVWYEATQDSSGNWVVTFDTANHNNDVGLYHWHIYVTDSSGSRTGYAAKTVTLKDPGVSAGMTVRQLSAKQAEVYLKGYDGNVFNIAVWSDKNGQDDLIWSRGIRQVDGSYKVTLSIANHNNDTGVYHIHAYYPSNVFIGARDITLTGVSYGDVSISDVTNGSFTVTVTGVTDAKTVKIPVWSDNNGQDDLIWYTATKSGSGTYKVTVDTRNHQNDDGVYHVHVYATDTDGTQYFLTGTTTTVQGMTISGVSVSTPVNGKFTVSISGLSAPNGVTTIYFPTWSVSGGQDDIAWYTASRVNGSYQVTVNTKNHNGGDVGKYNIHVYGKDSTGKLTFLGNTTVTVPQITGTLKTTNNGDGTFEVRLTNVKAPNGITKIKFPVWTEANGQDDLVWYTASKSGDDYVATVRIKDHNSETGVYNVHCYGTDNNGKQVGVASTTMALSSGKMTLSSVDISTPTNGQFTVTTKLASTPNGVSKIRYAVWSDNNGQDDLVWYTAKASSSDANTYSLTIDTANHNGDTGVYNVHIYGVDSSGQQYGLIAKTVTVPAGSSSSSSTGSTSSTAEKVTDDTQIMGTSSVTAAQLATLYTNNAGISFPSYYVERGIDLNTFCQYYIDEAAAEGVRADIAFAQAMHETGWLAFGGDVKISQFNFAGLGATGGGVSGEDFAAKYGDNATGIQMGIRAQIQHLKAYASTESLNNACVDSRYDYVSPKGKAPTIGGLTGTWATDSTYSTKIINIVNKIV